MRYKAPWQVLVAGIGIAWLLYIGAAVLAIAGALINIQTLSLIGIGIGTFACGLSIPLHLNYTRSSYWIIIPWQFIHALITILTFAVFYARAGLLEPNGGISHSFSDAFYLSFTTWTALGSDDLIAPKSLRMLSSIEAVCGMIFMPILTAVYLQAIIESTVEPKLAYLDKRKFKFDRDGDIISERKPRK